MWPAPGILVFNIRKEWLCLSVLKRKLFQGSCCHGSVDWLQDPVWNIFLSGHTSAPVSTCERPQGRAVAVLGATSLAASILHWITDQLGRASLFSSKGLFRAAHASKSSFCEGGSGACKFQWSITWRGGDFEAPDTLGYEDIPKTRVDQGTVEKNSWCRLLMDGRILGQHSGTPGPRTSHSFLPKLQTSGDLRFVPRSSSDSTSIAISIDS